MQCEKIKLRQTLRQQREVLDPGWRLQTSQILADNIMQLEMWQNAKVIGLFASQMDEMETSLLWSPGKTFSYPRIECEKLHYCKTTQLSELQRGTYGLLEPFNNERLTPDLVLVPGVAFDAKGGRLGRGKGFYDRWLQAHPTVVKVGVCFDFQIVPAIPMEAHDQTVDFVVTEKRTLHKSK